MLYKKLQGWYDNLNFSIKPAEIHKQIKGLEYEHFFMKYFYNSR